MLATSHKVAASKTCASNPSGDTQDDLTLVLVLPVAHRHAAAPTLPNSSAQKLILTSTYLSTTWSSVTGGRPASKVDHQVGRSSLVRRTKSLTTNGAAHKKYREPRRNAICARHIDSCPTTNVHCRSSGKPGRIGKRVRFSDTDIQSLDDDLGLGAKYDNRNRLAPRSSVQRPDARALVKSLDNQSPSPTRVHRRVASNL